MAKDPDQRYQTPGEMLADLEAFEPRALPSPLPRLRRKGLPWPPGPKKLRRRPNPLRGKAAPMSPAGEEFATMAVPAMEVPRLQNAEPHPFAGCGGIGACRCGARPSLGNQGPPGRRASPAPPADRSGAVVSLEPRPGSPVDASAPPLSPASPPLVSTTPKPAQARPSRPPGESPNGPGPFRITCPRSPTAAAVPAATTDQLLQRAAGLEKSNPDQARALLEQAVAQSPNNFEAHFQLGGC